MNILIITPFYKHDRNIASVRWTNLGTRLAKKHNVIIVTQPHDDMDLTTSVEKDEDNVLVARINQKTGYEKIAVKHFGAATGDDWQTAAGNGDAEQFNDNFKRKLKNRLLFASMKKKAKQYAKEIEKNVIPKDMKIDVVISSACPFIEMLFGYELKKRLGCKWISDFRDLPFVEDNSDVTHIQKRIMQDAFLQVDTVTVVVPCMKYSLMNWFGIEDRKIHVLTNGFSLKERRIAKPNDDTLLHIVHTGSLYGGRRRADLLYEAINNLKTSGYTDLVFEIAGGNNTSLLESAKKYDCIDIVKDYGFLSREEALELQLKADCLVAIVERYSLPAKIFEYILNQRPIICLVVGNENIDSQAKPIIEKLKVGKVYEEIKWEDDVKRLTEYLRDQIERKKQGEKLEYQPDINEVSKFDHDSLAIQLEAIMQSISNTQEKELK